MAARKKKSTPKPKALVTQTVDFSHFIAFLRAHLASCEHNGGGGSIPKFPPFELMPQDYLSYALEAIKNPTDANRINCVGHLKRAAECQADTILHVLALSKRSQTRNFPCKMETISKLDLIPSRSLTKLNSIRNAMEHEYAVPDIEDLELYFDLVAGFVAALEGAIFMMVSTTHMDFRSSEDDATTDVQFSMEYDWNVPEIKCEMRDNTTISQFSVTPDDWGNFLATLRVTFLLIRYTYLVSSDYVLARLDTENAT